MEIDPIHNMTWLGGDDIRVEPRRRSAFWSKAWKAVKAFALTVLSVSLSAVALYFGGFLLSAVFGFSQEAANWTIVAVFVTAFAVRDALRNA